MVLLNQQVIELIILHTVLMYLISMILNLISLKTLTFGLWIVLDFYPQNSCTFDKVMNWIELLKPKKQYLHMNYEVDYERILSVVPKNCFPAYDGMKLSV